MKNNEIVELKRQLETANNKIKKIEKELYTSNQINMPNRITVSNLKYELAIKNKNEFSFTNLVSQPSNFFFFFYINNTFTHL